MTKQELVEKIKELLKTENLETLIACIRDRVDQK
jgi:hypothetical protein